MHCADPAWDGAHEAARSHVAPIRFVADDSRRLIVTSKATISVLEQLLAGTESKCRVESKCSQTRKWRPVRFVCIRGLIPMHAIGFVDRVKRSDLARRLQMSRPGQTYVV